jgi:lysozyme
MRAVPKAAVEFVKAHEGCKLAAYEDVAGVVTVGYGHVALGMKPGQTITQSLADIYLQGDLETAARGVCTQLSEPVLQNLTDNQYAALISFVFNEGPNPKATLWKVLNARNHDAVPGELARWVYVSDQKTGKKVKVQGLVNRRAAETVLWSTAEPGSIDTAPSSAATRVLPTTAAPAKPASVKAHVIACVSVVGAACTQYAKPIKDAADQLGAFSGSHIIAHVTEALLTVAGIATLAGLAATLIKNRQAAR